MEIEFMTFRPSDDVLEEISADAQSNTSENQYYNEGTSSEGQQIFHKPDDIDSDINTSQSSNSYIQNDFVIDEPIEEIKAPDLSELLKSDNFEDKTEDNDTQNNQPEQDFSIDLSGIQSINNQDADLLDVEQKSTSEDTSESTPESTPEKTPESTPENTPENTPNNFVIDEQKNIEQFKNIDEQEGSSESKKEGDYFDDKMGDEDRANLVSSIEGSSHSKIDFLVDEQWFNVIKNYKKINRIVFRRGIFIIATVLGICAGISVQVKANQSEDVNVIKEAPAHNMDNFSNDFVLTDLSENTGINLVIPYGFSKMNGEELSTKSNLIFYKGIVLPQNAFINIDSNKIISLEDFENKRTSRADLENTIKILITDNSVNRRLNIFPSVSDSKGQGQTLQGGLIDGFDLGCMFTTKASNKVCYKILDIFYKYGKYYNLSNYGSDLLKLVREVKNQNISTVPICNMVKEYVLNSGIVPSDVIGSVMRYCSEEDQVYYKKLVDFIDLENSLGQPELSDKVFDDPDLNAYKLLSAQQSVHKILDGSSINKNFIVSYLNFAQNLINKDRGYHNYINPLYLDLLYVFNMDELYDKLLKKGELSSDLKAQIDQINNGNVLLKYESLLSHLTTSDIVVSDGEFTGSSVIEKTIEDIFYKYYTMTDRLRIRNVSKISDTQLKVQSEIFSSKIKGVAEDTLKATILLYRIDNILYVEKINISNQPKLSDILNVSASSKLVSFDDMIGFIDDQVGFWYEEPQTESIVQKSICEQLSENKDIVIYSCDDTNILLYNGNIEYNFILENGILNSFSINDADLESIVKERFKEIMFNRDNTPTIINSIVKYKEEINPEEDSKIEQKLQIIDQFRIHFKLIPKIYDIEGEYNIFLVEFTLGDEYVLHARYNVDSHLLTRISYFKCDKTLEIRNLTIEVSADNEAQLTEILNNPRIFFTKANPAAFKKYQTMCEGSKN